MTFVDILNHIFDQTMDFHFEYIKVDDISRVTNCHYSGPGYVIDVRVPVGSDDVFEKDHAIYDIVLDSTKNYLGTMAWINPYSGWFNDSVPDNLGDPRKAESLPKPSWLSKR